MVKPEKIILDKKTFLTTAKANDKLRWMISVNNVGSCGWDSFSDIVKSIDSRGICSVEAMKILESLFSPVKISAGEQLELF